MDTPEAAPVATTETPTVSPEVTPEVAPAADKPKRVRNKKPEVALEVTEETPTQPKTTDWSLGFTIVDN